MSVENGKCPSCGGALLLDSSKEKMICKFCGHEVVIQQAIQKVTVDGIAGFDTQLLKAQRALELDEDFDKAAKYYREALELRPDDFKALWGAFMCEIASITYASNFKGYVQIPGDIPDNIAQAIRKYGNRAYNNAPEEIKPYYYREISRLQDAVAVSDGGEDERKKKGCYIATCVYGAYDCPQVWVLRRYRDNYLETHFWGKMFIKSYYFISPKVVRAFGKRRWFNAFWRKVLDRKINLLKQRGVDDTPYND